jgi:hypothetical protein
MNRKKANNEIGIKESLLDCRKDFEVFTCNLITITVLKRIDSALEKF